MMLEDGLNEEHIGITNYLQLTPAIKFKYIESYITSTSQYKKHAWKQLTHAKLDQ